MTATVQTAGYQAPPVGSMTVTLAAGDSYLVGQTPANTTFAIEPGSGATVTVKAKAGPGATLAPIDPANASYTASALIVAAGPAYSVTVAATGGTAVVSVAYPQ